MAPQQLKIYILHHLCEVIMVSVFRNLKRLIWRFPKIDRSRDWRKNIIEGYKNMKLTEVDLHGTSTAEKIKIYTIFV